MGLQKFHTKHLGITLIAFALSGCFLQAPRAPERSSMSALEVFHSSEGIAKMACMECHEKNRKVVAGGHYLGEDCRGCHTPTAWKDATNFGHNPIPTQCNACHATGQRFDKFPPGHLATGSLDCISCHRASITGGFVDWKGGTFEHTSTVINAKNCNSCHEKDRPPTVTLLNINPSINDGRVVDKTHFAGKDCFVCHEAPTAALPTLTWRGRLTTYEHGNALNQNLNFCLSCHMRSEHVGQHGSVANDIVNDGKCQQCHQRRRSWDNAPRNPNL